jgi:hypothetical protein
MPQFRHRLIRSVIRPTISSRTVSDDEQQDLINQVCIQSVWRDCCLSDLKWGKMCHGVARPRIAPLCHGDEKKNNDRTALQRTDNIKPFVQPNQIFETNNSETRSDPSLPGDRAKQPFSTLP